MEVSLRNISKRFDEKAVLHEVDLELKPGDRILIGGPNGSGKSTLLKLIAAFLRPSEGRIEHRVDGELIEADKAYRRIALAAPYLEFPEELTLLETIKAWERFRPLKKKAEELPRKMNLEGAEDRRVRELSSGMLQRLRLGIAFFTDCPLLLLDEPLTNVDAEGRELYHQLLEAENSERSVLVCSNEPEFEAPSGHTPYRIVDGSLQEGSSSSIP